MSTNRPVPAATLPQWSVALVIAALAVLVIWVAGHVFLLAYAGVLLGVFLQMTARFVSRHTSLRHGWALAVTIGVLLTLAGVGIWQAHSAITSQLQQLSKTVPAELSQIEARLEGSFGGRVLLQQLSEAEQSGETISRNQVISQATTLSGKMVRLVIGMIVVFFVGLYAAAEPDLYRSGSLKLLPVRHRERAAEVLRDLQQALESWVLAQLASMCIVGTLVTVGLLLIGVEGAFVLGLFAAALELIPTFGPLLAATPALLAGLADGAGTAARVAGLYLAVQLLEGYVILPLIQERAVDVPPALLIVMVVLFGYLGGVLGALIATPLLVTIMVLVNRLYREDHLGEPE